jgi:hypothetical protein
MLFINYFCIYSKMKNFKPHSNYVIKSFYLWINVFGVVIKQKHSELVLFKWFKIWYVCLLYMCKFFENNSKIKFHLFHLNKVWERKCIQSLIFNSSQCECYIINFLFCTTKLNGNWFGKDNGLSTCKPRFKLESQQQPYIDHICWMVNIDYIGWLVNVDHFFTCIKIKKSME